MPRIFTHRLSENDLIVDCLNDTPKGRKDIPWILCWISCVFAFNIEKMKGWVWHATLCMHLYYIIILALVYLAQCCKVFSW